MERTERGSGAPAATDPEGEAGEDRQHHAAAGAPAGGGAAATVAAAVGGADADDADVVEVPAAELEALVARQLEGHGDLAVGGLRAEVDVLEPPLAVDVMDAGDELVGAGAVLPHGRAIGVDDGVIEEAILDAEPAPVLQVDGLVGGDVDLRHGRELDSVRLVRAVVAAGAEVDAEDVGARERGGRVAGGAGRGAPLPLARGGAGGAGVPVSRVLIEAGAVDGLDRADVHLVHVV